MIASRLGFAIIAALAVAAGRVGAVETDPGTPIDLAALSRLPGASPAPFLPCATIDAAVLPGPDRGQFLGRAGGR
jgi:hypothetical protein